MTHEYHNLGESDIIADVDSFEWDTTKELFNACCANSSFEVIERQTERDESGNLKSESIIVDCWCGLIGTRNKVGIKNRERLALLCSKSIISPYEVYPLRKGFPLTIHQMFISHNSPATLCLYVEPWDICKRTWTPQQFLNRIILWLTKTANGDLHTEDQPPEHLFFQSPYKLYLPSDFADQSQDSSKIFTIYRINKGNGQDGFRGVFIDQKMEQPSVPRVDSVPVTLPCVIHGQVELPPKNLGLLDDYFRAKGSGIVEYIAVSILAFLPNKPFRATDSDSLTMLLCNIPVSRSPQDAPERFETLAYILSGGIKSLAVSLNLTTVIDNEHYSNSLLLGDVEQRPALESWRNILITPVEIRMIYSETDARKASGIEKGYEKFSGVLGGVGALGSSLADIWSREGWGDWLYIDSDIVEPHNIVRHTATSNVNDIGFPKSEVVDRLSSSNYGARNRNPIFGKINDFSNEEVVHALRTSSLIVDATTTLDAPRDLAKLNTLERCVSTFISPTGKDSVLLFEDTSREIRLNTLEYQYYRLIIRESWGKDHLAKNLSQFWAGAGCREITTVMPYDLVKMHSGLLARQIRELSSQPESTIKIFQYNDASGEITVHHKTGTKSHISHAAGWDITYDDELVKTLHELRNCGLPAETGGVLVGYIDQEAKQIYIVDGLSAPNDSVQEETGFERGCEGLHQKISEIGEKTASIVGYIGEWHSHPTRCSSCPSALDVRLLASLKGQMNLDGLPILMLIVGETDFTVCLGGEKSCE